MVGFSERLNAEEGRKVIKAETKPENPGSAVREDAGVVYWKCMDGDNLRAQILRG